MLTLSRPSPLDARRIVYLSLFLTLVLHGALLPFTLGQTYDAYIHMFFGDHYHRSWFDSWEPRWYTGFTVTAYPPGSHQLIGLLLHVVSHHIAFILVQLLAISILVIGVYRFSRLWVSDMAAAMASLLCVASTAIAETVHIFGQLPTTLSLGIFLNATPHIYAWIRHGQRKQIPLALIFTAGATAAHHVTPIFATLLFVAPLGMRAWVRTLPSGFKPRDPSTWQSLRIVMTAPLRGMVLGLMMFAIIMLVVFPYWYWSVTDPITQVSIPHGSRESFLARPEFGLMFFIIPWGPLLAVIPYVIWCAARTTLWPLAASLLLCLILGTGGTTPIPRMLLGSAFDIMTLDRFTFWAAIMALPFAGAGVLSLLTGHARAVMVAAVGTMTTKLCLALAAIMYGVSGVLVATLPLVQPTQPAYLDPDPIVQFMATDDHNQWRYLTLGFGDQFAYHSALIDGLSVDGNYHSVRRLPHMTAYSVERLENSKYLGLPALSALKQFIINAEDYHLKYVFSNDAFYDPLLYYGGWTRLKRLRNGVVVWEKPGITPLEYPLPRRPIAPYKTLMWGIIPPISLFLVFASLIGFALTGRLIPDTGKNLPPLDFKTPCHRVVTAIRYAAFIAALGGTLTAVILLLKPTPKYSAEQTLLQYYSDLDVRDFETAYDRLNPSIRPDYETYLKTLRSRGGLIWSYAKLLDTDTKSRALSETQTEIETTRTYLTALGVQDMTSIEMLTKTETGWHVNDPIVPKRLTSALMTRAIESYSHDLSVTRKPVRGTGSSSFENPIVSASDPVLINLGKHVQVVGSVTNTSTHSACLDVIATAQFDDGKKAVQRMGEMGSHRLAPGETRHYSVEFESILQQHVTDTSADSDPEFFRLPEFTKNPDHVDVRISSFLCQAKGVSALTIDHIEAEASNALNVTLTNQGTKVASIIKLSLTYFDDQGRAVLVKPYYLETNLIPGEMKTESIPLYSGASLQVIKPLDRPLSNGRSVAHQPSLATTRIILEGDSPFKSVLIEIDAMPDTSEL